VFGRKTEWLPAATALVVDRRFFIKKPSVFGGAANRAEIISLIPCIALNAFRGLQLLPEARKTQELKPALIAIMQRHFTGRPDIRWDNVVYTYAAGKPLKNKSRVIKGSEKIKIKPHNSVNSFL
jgi:hypothetical protein